MANERIPGLPTTIDPVSGFDFIMDKGGLSAVKVPYADIYNAIFSDSGWLDIVSTQSEVTVISSKVRQVGKNVSGNVRFELTSPVAGGFTSLMQLPVGVEYPSIRINFIPGIPVYQGSPGAIEAARPFFIMEVGSSGPGEIRPALSTDLAVGVDYAFTFSYNV